MYVVFFSLSFLVASFNGVFFFIFFSLASLMVYFSSSSPHL
jgi:hypothetical protein